MEAYTPETLKAARAVTDEKFIGGICLALRNFARHTYGTYWVNIDGSLPTLYTMDRRELTERARLLFPTFTVEYDDNVETLAFRPKE